jgi:hypothetical protein
VAIRFELFDATRSGLDYRLSAVAGVALRAHI